MRDVYCAHHDRSEHLEFDKWNRRLLNLYWVYNGIILFTELALLYYFYYTDTLLFSLRYHCFNLIVIPTWLILGTTILCEAIVRILKKKHRHIIAYAMTVTSVVYCSILFVTHYGMVVLGVTYIVPIVISLFYDNKKILRTTFICALGAFAIACFIILRFGDSHIMRINTGEIITSLALLITTYLLCGTILNRNREIINTLIEAEHSAYELEIAKTIAEAAADARTHFLAIMSHEIRTPMNGIIGLTELAIDDEALSTKQKDYLLKIYKSADRLLHIVNNILEITKIDAGELNLEKIPFDLQEVLDGCRTSMAHDAMEKGLQLEFIYSHDSNSKLIGDPTKLGQALLNLLSNAIKFTEKGSVTLCIKSKRVSNIASVCFEVADTGMGFTEEQHTVIFEPFRQADDSMMRKFGGTGLGLSITKSIVEMMGGKIQAESTPGIGSRFSFELMLPIFDEKSELAKTCTLARDSRKMLTGSVLVCEDNDINRQVAIESLEKLGLTVTIAENGRCAIDVVVNHIQEPFDVILMDIHTPVMDGFNAAARIIKMGIQTPIIAMTANAMHEDRERCLQLGMVDYIVKPFKLQDLWLCLSKYLTHIEKTVGLDSVQNTNIVNNAPIDIYFGIENSAGSEILHNKMLKRFSENARNNYNRLENAIAISDYTLAFQIAHTERGAANIIGAVRLARILGILEDAAKTAVAMDYSIMISAYNMELEIVLEYLKAYA